MKEALIRAGVMTLVVGACVTAGAALLYGFAWLCGWNPWVGIPAIGAFIVFGNVLSYYMTPEDSILNWQ